MKLIQGNMSNMEIEDSVKIKHLNVIVQKSFYLEKLAGNRIQFHSFERNLDCETLHQHLISSVFYVTMTMINEHRDKMISKKTFF